MLPNKAASASCGWHRDRTGPYWVRESLEWRDTLYLTGFGQACTATRARKFSLIIPSGPLVTKRIEGDCIPWCVTGSRESRPAARSSIPRWAPCGRFGTSQRYPRPQ